MQKSLILVAFTAVATSSIAAQSPAFIEFGASLSEMTEKLLPFCDSIKSCEINPIELPTATTSQVQLDLYGYKFEGRKRNIELVFADDKLDLVWILISENEQKKFIRKFNKSYGAPSHDHEEVTFYLEHGAAIRYDPSELLFISDRLKAPYKKWLDNM